MKKIHIILLLALGLGVSSCFTSYISNKQVMGVQQGTGLNTKCGMNEM